MELVFFKRNLAELPSEREVVVAAGRAESARWNQERGSARFDTEYGRAVLKTCQPVPKKVGWVVLISRSLSVKSKPCKGQFAQFSLLIASFQDASKTGRCLVVRNLRISHRFDVNIH